MNIRTDGGKLKVNTVRLKEGQRKICWKNINKQKALIFMSFPFVIYTFIFNYLPIWGWLMAFQQYKPGKSIFMQKWVGLRHFQVLFSDAELLKVIRNSLAMSLINMILGFSTAIILALMLNEVRNALFKRTVQTISYLPHFVSWVVAANIVLTMLEINGPINNVLVALGITDKPVLFMAEGKYFWWIVGISNVWKNVGWNSIIYLAAMAGINPELYEAAEIDGAKTLQKIWHITLPGISPTIVILLIMSIGHLMSSGFEQQFLLTANATNGLVMEYAQNIEIYVMKRGIAMGQFSFGTAAGIFNSVVSVSLLLIANFIAKKLGQEKVI